MRGVNVEEVGATDIEETKLPTPVLRIYEASVVPCPQLRPTIVACSVDAADLAYLDEQDLVGLGMKKIEVTRRHSSRD